MCESAYYGIEPNCIRKENYFLCTTISSEKNNARDFGLVWGFVRLVWMRKSKDLTKS